MNWADIDDDDDMVLPAWTSVLPTSTNTSNVSQSMPTTPKDKAGSDSVAPAAPHSAPRPSERRRASPSTSTRKEKTKGQQTQQKANAKSIAKDKADVAQSKEKKSSRDESAAQRSAKQKNKSATNQQNSHNAQAKSKASDVVSAPSEKSSSIVGTCIVLEKSYVRLGDTPDPSTVRTEDTLKNWHRMLLTLSPH